MTCIAPVMVGLTCSSQTGNQCEAIAGLVGDGLYAEAMGGFLQWLAGRYDEARTVFDAKVAAQTTVTWCGAGLCAGITCKPL